jgi:hypothetical protein
MRLNFFSLMKHILSHPTTQAITCQFPIVAAWFDPRSGHVGFVVDIVALE